MQAREDERGEMRQGARWGDARGQVRAANSAHGRRGAPLEENLLSGGAAERAPRWRGGGLER